MLLVCGTFLSLFGVSCIWPIWTLCFKSTSKIAILDTFHIFSLKAYDSLFVPEVDLKDLLPIVLLVILTDDNLNEWKYCSKCYYDESAYALQDRWMAPEKSFGSLHTT